ncbi:gas vesicle accessory protein GvpU [Pseudomonas sp. Teo4]|uniref:gas vesicle accessory protein GvpU n=1 Tax=Pseudomonas sp. Teo4 TaxID=3064528 RepID=UPI002AB88DDE|nr:gas vesicle accessory protein GvpU [Pseudomonas sp. Teo4]MDZ3990360.1 hypothetical protein [Pseudomonas sp. Teo4]
MKTDPTNDELIQELRDDLSDPVLLHGSWHGRGVDDTLQHLVHLANEGGVEMGITLMVGGALVSGYLISSETYFQRVIDSVVEVSAPGENPGVDAVAKLLAERTPPSGGPIASQFIHMRDARFYNGRNDPLPTNGTLWRGKIASVDGFSIGRLGSS